MRGMPLAPTFPRPTDIPPPCCPGCCCDMVVPSLGDTDGTPPRAEGMSPKQGHASWGGRIARRESSRRFPPSAAGCGEGRLRSRDRGRSPPHARRDVPAPCLLDPTGYAFTGATGAPPCALAAGAVAGVAGASAPSTAGVTTSCAVMLPCTAFFAFDPVVPRALRVASRL